MLASPLDHGNQAYQWGSLQDLILANICGSFALYASSLSRILQTKAVSHLELARSAFSVGTNHVDAHAGVRARSSHIRRVHDERVGCLPCTMRCTPSMHPSINTCTKTNEHPIKRLCMVHHSPQVL